MRLIFMGNPEFAVPSLCALHGAGHDIAAVVTGPDKPAGRGRRTRAHAVKTAAQRLRIPLLQPGTLRSAEAQKSLRDLNTDLAVVVAFSILPVEVLSIPRLGTINLHASLLPKYRGAAPIQWAVIQGEPETGVTVFFIEERVDAGRIILQCKTPIGPQETYGEVHDRLSILGAEALCDAVARIAGGRPESVEQNHAESTRAPKIRKEDGCLHWEEPAARLHNRIRGLAPVPGSYTFYGDMRVEICASRVSDVQSNGDPPGRWVGPAAERLLVQTGDGVLEILALKPENRKSMRGDEFIRGYAKTSRREFGNE